MINLYLILTLAFYLVSNILMLSYGIRIGKALQKEAPPVPLAEPMREVAKTISRAGKAGKKLYRLVVNMKEMKAMRKTEKDETGIFD